MLNFLKCFKRYLTLDDNEEIEKDKDLKGKVISQRIGIVFANVDKKKLNVVQNLIEKSCDIKRKQDKSAHSLIIENYAKEIKAYKERKFLEKIEFITIFCFLITLGITDEYFEDSFAFLSTFFEENLRPKKWKGTLEEYFQ